MEQLVVFDSLTFRMRREENNQEEGDREVDREEEIELLESEEVEGVDDDDDDDEADEQWPQALRLILSQGYGIYGDHYEPSLAGGEGLGVVRLYSCQQSLMKMHPLFDHAIAKVPNPPPNPLALLSKQPCAIIKTALRYYQNSLALLSNHPALIST